MPSENAVPHDSTVTPSISVITVVFNDADHLATTVESVLGQTIAGEIEYIIIDGGSSDGTVDVIRRYADRLAHWVSEPDDGLYDAMNKGIAASTGRYIGILNCGDEYLADGMEKLLTFAQTEDYEGVSGNLLWRHPMTGETTRKHYAALAREGRKCFSNQSCSLFRRDVYDRFGPFDTSLKIVADVDFYLKVQDQIKVGFIEEDISIFSLGGVSSSCHFRKIGKFYDEFRRLYARHDLPQKPRRLITNLTKLVGMSAFNWVASEKTVIDWVFRRYQAESRRFEAAASKSRETR